MSSSVTGSSCYYNGEVEWRQQERPLLVRPTVAPVSDGQVQVAVGTRERPVLPLTERVKRGDVLELSPWLASLVVVATVVAAGWRSGVQT